MDLEICTISGDYLDYLRNEVSSVPTKSKRPWIWPVRINGRDYAIPLTTTLTSAGHPGTILCPGNTKTALNIRYMVPVESAEVNILREPEMWGSLVSEREYYRRSQAYIQAEARVVHDLAVTGEMEPGFYGHSNDFAALERRQEQWREQEGEKEMPVSKYGVPYYTREQYEKAKYGSSALEYARAHGYELCQSGNYYTLKGHDSMIFTPSGAWFWNSRGVSGTAIEFQMYYENKTLTEAVLTLCGENTIEAARPQAAAPKPQAARPQPQATASKLQVTQTEARPSRAFSLPERAQDFKRLFGYLCKARGLEKSVVQDLIQASALYEAVGHTKDGREIHNACFVSYDNNGKPCGAYLRGLTNYGTPYKRELLGSDKSHGWRFWDSLGPVSGVAVFEAAIDAASYASLSRMGGSRSDMDLLALGGLDDKALENYLAQHPDTQSVVLCLDNDEPGRAAAARIQVKLREQGYTAEIASNFPEGIKDWNDFLMKTREEFAAQEAPVPAAEMED